MNDYRLTDMKKRQTLLQKGIKFPQGIYCKCPDPYVEINIDLDGFDELTSNLYKELEEHFSLNLSHELPYAYEVFIREYREYRYDKLIYDRMPDHKSLDQTNYKVKRLFAFENPDSPESQRFFFDYCNKLTYEELMSAILSEEMLSKPKQDRQEEKAKYQAVKTAEAVANARSKPTCPICHSTDLTRISVGTRAVKTAVFGVYGAMDDAGKTWKCNKCGSKF